MRRLFVVFLAAASAKEFFHAVDNADRTHNQQFAEFDGKGGDDREQAEFFRRQAADQRGNAVFGNLVGGGVEIGVALTGAVFNGGEKLLRGGF